jgi:putative Mn2+ efflux pump MntP
MGLITLFLIAVSLAMDVFAVSLGIGTSGQANAPRPIFRLSFHMGLFQGVMTYLGWLAGSSILQWIAGLDHWIAFLFLAFVGFRMILSGIGQETYAHRNDPSRGASLVMLSIATSIDALAVGLSLAVLAVNVLTSCLMIGLVSLILGFVGLRAGTRLSERFGKRMEILGGVVLNLIGLRILFTHLWM